MGDWSVVFEYKSEFIEGFIQTIEASLLALLLSLVIGVFMASIRMSGNKVLEKVAIAYVEFFQNTPLLIQIFFFYNGLPAIGIDLGRNSEFLSCMLGLAVYTGAYIAEVFRAGIQSISKGQMEAARSQGMNYSQAMWYIILPQSVRIILPPLGNQFINLVKNSAILGFFAGGDLMYHADIVSSRTFVVFEVYIFVGLLYLLLTVPLSFGVQALERRLHRSY